jgi:hypothetical protein
VRRWHAAVLWALAAGLSAIAGQRTWAHDGVLSVSGADATGGLVTTLAWASAALALLLLVVRRRGSRIVGAVALVLGIGALVSGLTASFPAQDLAASVAAQANRNPWRYAFAAAGLLLADGGVVALVTAGQVGHRPDRYSRRAEATDADLWKAMDAGHDPTEDPR